MSINQVQGQSIYLKNDNKFYNPIYIASRETIQKYSKSKYVLEIAGGPLYSTGVLSEQGYHIIDLELDDSLISYCNKTYPKVSVIKADIEMPLPSIENIEKVDVVVALDILEHLSRERAVSILQEIRSKIGSANFVCIISMPIVDWRYLNTWFEFIRAFLTFSKSRTGLFDSTHKLLISQEKHKKIFIDAGYSTMEEYTENGAEYLSGTWKTLDPSKISWKSEPFNLLYKKRIIIGLLAFIFHPFSAKKRKDFMIRNILIRGIYVIKPCL